MDHLRGLLCFISFLCVIMQVCSDQLQDDSELMQNDPYATQGRASGVDSGYGDALKSERSLLREERKRVKAERRRLKEERRQERRQLKHAGHEGTDGMDERNLLTHGPGGVTPGSMLSPSSISESPPQSSHHGTSHSSSSRTHTGQRSPTEYLNAVPVPEVVDLEWLRTNLSSLWSFVHTLARHQSRTFSHRGGSRGRSHHSGVVPPSNPEPCPSVEAACRNEEGQICSSHGTCAYCQCFCDAGHYGTFCQCDDHSCPLYDGMTCGGPSRGQCRCGGCVCRPGYTGERCECPTAMQSCISPESDNEICSGKGVCECGRCQCSDGHKGRYCEDTVYAAGVCEKLKSCVMCKAWKRDLPSCANCQITVTTVESLEPSMTTCVMVNSGCLLQFSYIPQTADAYTVLVPTDMACPAT